MNLPFFLLSAWQKEHSPLSPHANAKREKHTFSFLFLCPSKIAFQIEDIDSIYLFNRLHICNFDCRIRYRRLFLFVFSNREQEWERGGGAGSRMQVDHPCVCDCHDDNIMERVWIWLRVCWTARHRKEWFVLNTQERVTVWISPGKGVKHGLEGKRS